MNRILVASLLLGTTLLTACDKNSKKGEKSESTSGAELKPLGNVINHALMKSDVNRAGIKGCKLLRGIMLCNVESRDGEIWARTAGPAEGAGEDSICGRTFKNSSDYFRALFDIDHKGTKDWCSYLGDMDIDVLKISKSPEFCDWIVCANLETSYDDNLPFLISANVDPKTLKTSYDGNDDGKVIPVGSAVGRTQIPWGDHFVIVVRKCGMYTVIDAKKFTLDALYDGHPVSIPEGCPKLEFLDVK